MAAMQIVLPLMMMSSACLSCSSCCGSLLAPIFFFWNKIKGLFSFLNPFKAAGKVTGAVSGAAKKVGRGISRAGKTVGRGISRAGKTVSRGISRTGSKIKSGVNKAFDFRRRCFSPETIVKLQNGRTVMMKDLKLGDVLINGSVVDAVMKIKNENDPYYKLPGNILVTGSHYVRYAGKYIHVKNVPEAKPTGKVEPVVYCLVTSDHKIPVGEYTFWDWEDNLIPTRENVDTIFKKLKSQRSVTVK
jgi:hypothetical protein